MINNKLQLVTSFFRVKGLRGALALHDSFGAKSKLKAAEQNRMLDRQGEYLWCVLHNAFHSHIEKVHLLVEDEESLALLQTWDCYPYLLASGKLQVNLKKNSKPMGNENQIMYSDLFALAQFTQKARNSFTPTLIANSDIFLPRSFQGLSLPLIQHLKRGGVFALTRWEEDGSSPLVSEYNGSHDGFIFVPNMYTFRCHTTTEAASRELFDGFLKSVKHAQNRYQSENVVIHELFHRFGHKSVKNPCYSIKLHHKHAVRYRQWLPSVVTAECRADERYGVCKPCLM